MRSGQSANLISNNLLCTKPGACKIAEAKIGYLVDSLRHSARSMGMTFTSLGTADCPIDIWVRDWGPTAGCYFQYDPSYARGLYKRDSVARARRNLNRHLGFTPREMPLVLEGGNLVHNDRVAIVTEKVFADNKHLSRGEIKRIFLSLGLERVVFIPVEPDDSIGHADGIVKFLRPGLLLVNDYVGSEFRDYRRRLYRILQRADSGRDRSISLVLH